VILSGKRVRLRDERREGDDGDMFRWLNMEDWAYHDHPDRPFEPIGRAEFDERLKRRASGEKGRVWKRWQMDSSRGEHVGWVNCYDLDEVVGSTYVGICLPDPVNRRRGMGREALELLAGYLFRRRRLREVRVTTWTGNTPMIRCALGAGFREVSRSPHRAERSIRGEALERIDLAISWSEWEEAGGA
jgi:RimJ/RimL family protein N-acetyltransferase